MREIASAGRMSVSTVHRATTATRISRLTALAVARIEP